MRTTLISGAALALASVLPVKAEPPPEGTIANIAIPAVFICYTQEQITAIATAALEGGVEAAMSVFRPLNDSLNEKGERICTAQPLRGTVAIGESVYVGHGLVQNIFRRFWAVHVAVLSGETYWMLWDESLPRSGGAMV